MISDKPSKQYTFQREERLKSKKLIELLFAKGKGISSNPIRLVYLLQESANPLPQVLFSVSKRNFKRAVDRNLIKRQMREIYRLHRNQYFTQEAKNAYLLAFIYTAKEKIPFNILEKKLNLALERLKNAGNTIDTSKNV